MEVRPTNTKIISKVLFFYSRSIVDSIRLCNSSLLGKVLLSFAGIYPGTIFVGEDLTRKLMGCLEPSNCLLVKPRAESTSLSKTWNWPLLSEPNININLFAEFIKRACK